MNECECVSAESIPPSHRSLLRETDEWCRLCGVRRVLLGSLSSGRFPVRLWKQLTVCVGESERERRKGY